MHPEKKIIFLISAAALVTLAILAVLVVQRSHTSKGSTPAAFLVPPPMPTSPDGLMHSLSGQVTAVNGGTFTLLAVLPGKTMPGSVTVTAASNATITLQTPKDPAVFAKEMAAYQKQVASTSGAYGAVPPPMPYIAKTISLSDIKVGMSVMITPIANTKEDATSVTAQMISAYVLPTLPSTLTPL